MSLSPDRHHIPPHQLLSPEFILTRIIESYTFLIKTVRQMGDAAFERVAGPVKPLSKIDFYVEEYFYALVAGRLGDIQIVRTEDTVPSLVLATYPRCCVLIDILDGAHLYQKRLGNWCSAITVFDQATKVIYAAYIVQPSAEKIFYSTYENPKAFMMHVPGLSQMETFPSRVNHQEDYIEKSRKQGGWNRPVIEIFGSSKSLMNATVCLAAQRCSTLSALLDSARFPNILPWLSTMGATERELRSDGAELGFRFYNIGGNPMLARLCDGGADVVLDVEGSLANDWVPGAYIALRAGAYIGSFEGKCIDETDLARALEKPGEFKQPYIAASSEGLYRQALAVFSSLRS